MHAHLHAGRRAESVLHRLPVAVKFAVALLLILFTALLPVTRAPLLVIPAAILLLVLLVSRVALLPLVRRLLLLEPFVLGVALLAMFSPGPDRLALFLFLVTRCTLALLTMVLFASLTPFSDFLGLLKSLRIPLLLITTLALMHRYLFVLSEESGRMRRARQARSFTPQRRLAWWTSSTVIAQLFLRASRRADRIYSAMCARGWGAPKP
jgi:cobalt/nickel transport system permease protein